MDRFIYNLGDKIDLLSYWQSNIKYKYWDIYVEIELSDNTSKKGYIFNDASLDKINNNVIIDGTFLDIKMRLIINETMKKIIFFNSKILRWYDHYQSLNNKLSLICKLKYNTKDKCHNKKDEYRVSNIGSPIQFKNYICWTINVPDRILLMENIEDGNIYIVKETEYEEDYKNRLDRLIDLEFYENECLNTKLYAEYRLAN